MTMDEACERAEEAFRPLFPTVLRREVHGVRYVAGWPGRDEEGRKAIYFPLVDGDFGGLDASIAAAVADVRETDARWL